MRGKIDLTGHKLAGVFRPPAIRTHYKRHRAPKMPDRIYRQIVRLVDGAVRDTFANHPDYLTDKGRHHAANSIIKRTTGTLWGYAKEASFAAETSVARGRSEAATDVLRASAATQTDAALEAGVKMRGSARLWAVAFLTRHRLRWRALRRSTQNSGDR